MIKGIKIKIKKYSRPSKQQLYLNRYRFYLLVYIITNISKNINFLINMIENLRENCFLTHVMNQKQFKIALTNNPFYKILNVIELY